MKLTRVHLALAVGGALIAAAIFAAAGGWWTPWAARYIQGVDVSHHQGAIDWRALAADNVAFAYIKATEGADHIDTRFAFNWREAEAAGLHRGAYHFFTLCQPGARQAANFIAVVPRVDGALPPAVDLEHMGPCREGPTMPDVIAEARTFMDRVEQYYGVRPIIYTTREFHDAHLADLRGERFWIRSIAAPPSFRQADWIIWQHHNRGHRRGVEGPVDLNAFRGDAAALARFATAGAQTVTWTLSSWQDVPSMNRVADEAAFQRGEAVFYQRGRQAEVMNIKLPAPAILTADDGQTIAVIVVQAERSEDGGGPLELLGGISPNGDHHVFTSADARLVEATDPQWRALVAGRS